MNEFFKVGHTYKYKDQTDKTVFKCVPGGNGRTYLKWVNTKGNEHWVNVCNFKSWLMVDASLETPEAELEFGKRPMMFVQFFGGDGRYTRVRIIYPNGYVEYSDIDEEAGSSFNSSCNSVIPYVDTKVSSHLKAALQKKAYEQCRTYFTSSYNSDLEFLGYL